MAEYPEGSFSEEEEDNSVVRVFRRDRDDSGSASPSASDDGEIEFERKKTLSKKSDIVPHRNKDEEIEASLDRLKGQGKYMKLNVGGSLFYTTLGTLTKQDNMLRAMFSQRIPLETDEEGMIIIIKGGVHKYCFRSRKGLRRTLYVSK